MRERFVGLASITVLTIGLAWQLYEMYRSEQVIAQLAVFTQSGLADVDEASGGAFDPERGIAYLVDDDEAKVFIFSASGAGGGYSPQGSFPLIDLTGEKLKNKTLEDLEAAAYHEGKLYLITSHSNRRSGVEEARRQWFLEVSLEAEQRGQVLRKSSPRDAILARLDGPAGRHGEPLSANYMRDEEQQREMMNIEGLAIDGEGRAYLGFRNPLVDRKYAIVLRAGLDELFGPNPEFEAFLLPLSIKSNNYGISDMAVDTLTGDILILANSSRRFEFFDPALWRWRPAQMEGFQSARLVKAGLMKAPEHFRAKPEVLLVSNDNRVTLFADAEAYGGQLSFTRAELGLQYLASGR